VMTLEIYVPPANELASTAEVVCYDMWSNIIITNDKLEEMFNDVVLTAKVYIL
jgi:hypothetical protein